MKTFHRPLKRSVSYVCRFCTNCIMCSFFFFYFSDHYNLLNAMSLLSPSHPRSLSLPLSGSSYYALFLFIAEHLLNIICNHLGNLRSARSADCELTPAIPSPGDGRRERDSPAMSDTSISLSVLPAVNKQVPSGCRGPDRSLKHLRMARELPRAEGFGIPVSTDGAVLRFIPPKM